jgi:hypothetical protein
MMGKPRSRNNMKDITCYSDAYWMAHEGTAISKVYDYVRATHAIGGEKLEINIPSRDYCISSYISFE